MSYLLFGLLIAAVAATVARVIWLARQQRIGPRWVRALAVFCAAGLLFMLVSNVSADGTVSTFWQDHGVISGLLSNMFLLGIGFLIYEDGDLRAQRRLDSSVTAAGVSGIVDHLVDVEVALGLVSGDRAPHQHDQAWDGFTDDTKPLRWIRRHRERLDRTGGRRELDPRTWPAALPPVADGAWRQQLVDQSIRRLLAGIRDWAPVINTSRNGTRVLIAIAELRKDLMELSVLLHTDRPEAVDLLVTLRQRSRLLAHFLEDLSGATPPRQEVLITFDPVAPAPGTEIEWAADHSGRDMFGREWREVLARSEKALREGH